MKAILITGNPKFIQGPRAKNYYREIIAFLEHMGIGCDIDPGADYTCPPPADFYIGHSRGCERYMCVEDSELYKDRFLKFGALEGICHPVERKWLETYVPGNPGMPPPEHFEFIAEQRQAIEDLVYRIRSETPIPIIKRFGPRGQLKR